MKIEQEDINNFKKIMEKIRQDLSKTEPESQLVDKKSFINGILYHL